MLLKFYLKKTYLKPFYNVTPLFNQFSTMHISVALYFLLQLVHIQLRTFNYLSIKLQTIAKSSPFPASFFPPNNKKKKNNLGTNSSS